MTREEFFQKTPEERKDLIQRAGVYYYLGYDRELEKIPEEDVRAFIEMSNEERLKAAKQAVLDIDW